VVGVLLLTLIGVVLFLLGRTSQPDLASRTAPPPVPPVQVAASPAPTPPPAPAPVAAAPTPAPTPNPGAAVPQPSATPPGQVVAQRPATPAPTPGTAPAVVVPQRRTESHSGTTPPQPHERVARADSPPPGPAPRTREAAEAKGDDDEFSKTFGGGGGSSKPSRRQPQEDAPPPEPAQKKPGSVYVPPAPGSADLPDTLSTADILQYVVTQKPAILECVKKQKAKDADMSGKLVMKWTIQPNGHTASVQVASESDEFKSTYLASCMTQLIRGWAFPRHRSPQDPVMFPFKF